MTKHHLIITGTGRAGTTFLVQLFTALGLETGFADLSSAVSSNCNAGMEWDIRQADAPYVIKNPWLCDYLDEVIEEGRVIIDHAIIPVRDLFSAAESRRAVTRRTKADPSLTQIPGGLWHTDRGDEQETILALQLYKLIHALAKREIPVTLLHFPRLVHDPQYLYQKLKFLIADIPFQRFLTNFTAIAQPELIHSFTDRDAHMPTAVADDSID